MKKLFILLTALTGGFANAQPVIQSSNYYPAGTVLQFEIADITGQQPGAAGANQTWNFSGLNLTGESYRHRYMNAAATPFSSSFPGANIGIEITGNNVTDTMYMYQNKTNNFVTYDGNAVNDSGNLIIFKNTDPQTIFNFPVSYLWSDNDSVNGNMTIAMGGVSFQIFRYGSSEVIADGYGTLQLPGGNYTNCLRLKYRQLLTDSSVISGFPLPPTITRDNKTMYTWIQILNGIAVERLTMTYDTITDDNGTSFETYCQLNRTATTGIFQPAAEDQRFLLYPNPANETVNLKIQEPTNEEIHVQISDISGKVVFRQTIAMNRQEYSPQLNLENLQPGIYMVTIESRAGRFSQRLIRNQTP